MAASLQVGPTCEEAALQVLSCSRQSMSEFFLSAY